MSSAPVISAQATTATPLPRSGVPQTAVADALLEKFCHEHHELTPEQVADYLVGGMYARLTPDHKIIDGVYLVRPDSGFVPDGDNCYWLKWCELSPHHLVVSRLTNERAIPHADRITRKSIHDLPEWLPESADRTIIPISDLLDEKGEPRP